MKKKRASAVEPRVPLYKVVELSTVDETAIERTLNEWTSQGWKLDGIQFAMRESSKRPSMAFVFFTIEAPPARSVDRPSRQSRSGPAAQQRGSDDRPRAAEEAELRLRHLAGDRAKMAPAVSAWERLSQLAGDDES